MSHVTAKKYQIIRSILRHSPQKMPPPTLHSDPGLLPLFPSKIMPNRLPQQELNHRKNPPQNKTKHQIFPTPPLALLSGTNFNLSRPRYLLVLAAHPLRKQPNPLFLALLLHISKLHSFSTFLLAFILLATLIAQ